MPYDPAAALAAIKSLCPRVTAIAIEPFDYTSKFAVRVAIDGPLPNPPLIDGLLFDGTASLRDIAKVVSDKINAL